MYRLRASLLALKHDDGVRPNLESLGAGAVLALVSEIRTSGLVDVSYDGVVYTVFFSDLCDRGEALSYHSPGAASSV